MNRELANRVRLVYGLHKDLSLILNPVVKNIDIRDIEIDNKIGRFFRKRGTYK